MKLKLNLGKLFIFILFGIYNYAYGSINTITVDPTGDNDCSDGLCDLPSALETAEKGNTTFYLILKPGTHNINSPLYYTPSKAKSLIIKAEDVSNPPVINSTSGKPILIIHNPNNDANTYIKIEDVIFSGASSTAFLPAFLYIRTFKGNVKIYRTKFINGSGNKGIEVITDTGKVEFIQNVFEDGQFNEQLLHIKNLQGVSEISNNTGVTNISSPNIIKIEHFSGEILLSGNTLNGSSGRAVYVNIEDGNFIAERNRIKGFSTTGKGGGIYAIVKKGTSILRNNLIYNNNAQEGGGVYISSEEGKIYFVNNTIYGNTASFGGGANVFINSDVAELYIYNNILWNNTATSGGNDGDDLYVESDGDNNNSGAFIALFNNNTGANSDFDTANSEDLFISNLSSYTQGNNKRVDPAFTDPTADDFSLQNTSQMIDSGDSSAPNLPAEDIRGSLRGNIPDIGAYEYKDVPDRDVYVFPGELNMGKIYEGNSVSQSIFLYNKGDSNLTINSVSIDNTAVFSLTENCTGSLAPGNYCTIRIDFSPTSEGSFNASVSISTDDPNEQNISISVKGNGVRRKPLINVNCPIVISINIGNFSQSECDIRNLGSADLVVTNIFIEGDIYGELFIRTDVPFTMPCGEFPFSLPPNSQCKFIIYFIPKYEDFKKVNIVIESNDTDNSPLKKEMFVRGFYISSPYILQNVEIIPQSYDFGHVFRGFTSEALEITVFNGGNTLLPIELVDPSIGKHFFILEDDCSGKLLYPFTSCKVKVLFKPSSEGNIKDTLLVYTDLGIFEVKLEGISSEGIGIKISPKEVDFGTVHPNQKRETEIEIKNEGKVYMGKPVIYMDDSIHFKIIENTCSKGIKINESCKIKLRFTPSMYGNYDSSLIVEFKEPLNLKYTVTLKGKANKPIPQVKEKGCTHFSNYYILIIFLIPLIMLRKLL